MRPVLLALIIAATSVQALALTPEQEAVARCIREMPIEDLIHKRGSCLPPERPSDLPPNSVIFPRLDQWKAAREVVRFEVALSKCPRAARGPKAGAFWRATLAHYNATPPDVPLIKAWIRREIDKQRTEQATPTVGWCEYAKERYGELGRKQPRAIVMRDGSDSTAKCILDGSCSRANEVDVYFY